MNESLHFIIDNGLTSALVAAVIIAIVSAAWKSILDRRDRKKILDFLRKSKAETDFKFRSTEAISSHAKISEARVVDLCSKHRNIKRNEKEKQSWQIVD
jgi:hypothetical protein